MRILVLGGYGFIGAEIVRALLRSGHDVTGLGRHVGTGRRLVPDARWVGADIAKLVRAQDWNAHLEGVEAIVNAAGALQDGAADDLDAVHRRAIEAAVEAAERSGVSVFVQISAPGAKADASTAFMRTKAAGDAAVRASNLDWVVLKPGLVIGRGAYGGTALLRMLAAFPVITPLVFADSRVQTVTMDDLCAAVVASLHGDVALRRDYDLAENGSHSLREVVRLYRRHLGFSPARIEPDLPRWTAAPVGVLADIAGALGWRSALRSTALKVMEEGVLADPAPWRAGSGRSLSSLEQTLASSPATAQDRLHARAATAMPVMIAALGLFWIVSGFVGVARLDQAAALLPAFDPRAAGAAMAAGSLVDIVVGALVLVRKTARAGLMLSVAVALFYLVAGTLVAPHLWADPLGPYVKVLPAIALAIAAALLLEER